MGSVRTRNFALANWQRRVAISPLCALLLLAQRAADPRNPNRSGMIMLVGIPTQDFAATSDAAKAEREMTSSVATEAKKSVGTAWTPTCGRSITVSGPHPSSGKFYLPHVLDLPTYMYLGRRKEGKYM